MLTRRNPPQTTKTVARAVIRDGDLRIKDFVASPKETTDRIRKNKVANDGKAKEKDAAKKAKERALREEKRRLRSSIAAPALAPAPANPQDRSAPEVLGSDHIQDGRQRPDDAVSHSSSSEKQRQVSTVPGVRAAGQRKPLPSSRGSNGVKGSLAILGGAKNSSGSPSNGLVKPPSLSASSSRASVPTQHNAGTNNRAARSAEVRPAGQHGHPGSRGYNPQRHPEVLGFLPESVKEDLSPPAPAGGSSPKTSQSPCQSSPATKTGRPLAGQSFVAAEPLRGFRGLSFLGGPPLEGGILSSRSSVKKRPRPSYHTQEGGPGPSTGGTSATTTTRKRQRQSSAREGTSCSAYDAEHDYDDGYVGEE